MIYLILLDCRQQGEVNLTNATHQQVRDNHPQHEIQKALSQLPQ
jgi:hypothetical protein